MAVEEEPEDTDAQATPSSSAEDAVIAPPPPERKTNYQQVVITEIVSCTTFWAQVVEMGRWLIEG